VVWYSLRSLPFASLRVVANRRHESAVIFACKSHEFEDMRCTENSIPSNMPNVRPSICTAVILMGLAEFQKLRWLRFSYHQRYTNVSSDLMLMPTSIKITKTVLLFEPCGSYVGLCQITSAIGPLTCSHCANVHSPLRLLATPICPVTPPSHLAGARNPELCSHWCILHLIIVCSASSQTLAIASS
jgi:hypothetical protein